MRRRTAIGVALMALLAGACGEDGTIRDTSADREPETAQAPGAPGDPEKAGSHAFLYGVVVSTLGDPVAGAEIHTGDRTLGQTNRYGEFCVERSDASLLDVRVRRAGYVDAETIVEAEGDVELLLELSPTPPEDVGSDGTWLVLRDARGCGLAELEVTVEAAAGLHAMRYTTSGGGALWLPGELARAASIELTASCRRTGRTYRGRRRGERQDVRMRLDGRAPVMAEVALPPRDGRDPGRWTVSVLDELGMATEVVGVRTSKVHRAWVPEMRHQLVLVGTDTIASRPYSLGQVRVRPVAESAPPLELRCGDAEQPQIALLAAEEQAPTMWPTSLEDVDGAGMASTRAVPLRFEGGVCRLDRLDLDPAALSLLNVDPEDDARVLADTSLAADASRGAREVRLAPGRSSVELHMEFEIQPPYGLTATLARRGGHYRMEQRVPADGRVVWTGLSAGSFLLWLHRPGSGSDAQVRAFEGIRRVVVRPAGDAVVDVAWKDLEVPRAVLEKR